MKELFVVKTENGFEPVYDRPNSHLHPEMKEAINEFVINQLLFTGIFYMKEVVLETAIKQNHLVELKKGDKTVFIHRGGRKNLSNMVINREPEYTKKGQIIILRILPMHIDEEITEEYIGKLVLVSAFAGESGCPEPGTSRKEGEEKEKEELMFEEYWHSHALVSNGKDEYDAVMRQIILGNVYTYEG